MAFTEVLGAFAPILGGLFGKKPKTWSPADSRAGDIQGIRQGAEAAGFNPLAFIGSSGPGAYTAPGDNTMGTAIADTIAGLAQAFTPSANDKQKLNQYQAENEALRKQVTVESIRPTVPGLFGRAKGEPINLTNGDWFNEFDPAVDWTGKQVRAPRPDGTYDQHNPARTVLATPMGVTTPAPYSDAEDYEMRYGDPVSWAVGVANLAADAGSSLRSWTDEKGWTTPGTWAGLETAKKLRDMVPKTKPPDGYTETGAPFWINPDGSIKWRKGGTQ